MLPLAALSFVLCALASGGPEKPNAAPVTFETRTVERQDGPATASFSYPVIQAAPSRALQAALVQEIERFIVGEEGNAATPEAAADAFLAEHRRSLEAGPDVAGMPWSLGRTAEIAYQDAKVVSLRLEEGAYTGGAHGGSTVLYASFDPATGRRLGLADLIKPDGEERLLKIGERELRKKYEIPPERSLEDAGFTFEGGKFRLSPQIAVLAGGLVVYYNLYEIAPYVAGPTEIVIPRSQLAPIAKPDGPLGPG